MIRARCPAFITWGKGIMKKKNKRDRPALNGAMLAYHIKLLGMTKTAFAKQYKFKVNTLINWTLDITNPSWGQLKKLARALKVPAQSLLIPGEVHIARGWQAAMTRWAQEQIEFKRDTLKDNDALAFIKATSSGALDAEEGDGIEVTFQVQGPPPSPDTADG